MFVIMLTNDTINLVKMIGPFDRKEKAFERCLQHVKSWYIGSEHINDLLDPTVYQSLEDRENNLFFSLEDYNYDIYKLDQ